MLSLQSGSRQPIEGVEEEEMRTVVEKVVSTDGGMEG
jgi:hypothetical protein